MPHAANWSLTGLPQGRQRRVYRGLPGSQDGTSMSGGPFPGGIQDIAIVVRPDGSKYRPDCGSSITAPRTNRIAWRAAVTHYGRNPGNTDPWEIPVEPKWDKEGAY